MRRKQATPSARALIAAFTAVAVSFMVATLVSEWSDVKIRRDAAHITGNAAPSIARLEAIRSEARRLVVLADDYIDQAVEQAADRRRQSPAEGKRGRRVDRATPSTSPLSPAIAENAMAVSLKRLENEWQGYRALPTFQGEGELASLVAGMKAAFVADLGRALDAARAGDSASALDTLDQRVKPAADALDDATVKLVELNAREATRLASRIDNLGRRSIRLAVALDGFSLLLTSLAAFLVYRFMSRYARLMELRAEELELFAGRVAHDVLSPLGAASLALSYLIEKVTIEDPRARRMLALGQRGIQRTRLIADDLLEFASAGARPDRAARANVRVVVAAVIDEARALAEERAITLSLETIDAGSVRCSQGILSSLVSNLVRNAVKYVGTGPGKRVVVRARRLGVLTRVEVEDNGPGLPAAMEAAVFEPYVRAPGNNQPGIGLGLATVKRVTEAHGGRVDVRSVLGAGCCFWFELPSVSDDDPAGAQTAEKNAQKSTQKDPQINTEESAEESAEEKPLPPQGNPPRVAPEDAYEDEHHRGTSSPDARHPGKQDRGSDRGQARVVDGREDTNPSRYPG